MKYYFDFGSFTMNDVPISSLARESRLVLVIYGRTLETPEGGDSSNAPQYRQEEIGWAAVQFFAYERYVIVFSFIFFELKLLFDCATFRNSENIIMLFLYNRIKHDKIHFKVVQSVIP